MTTPATPAPLPAEAVAEPHNSTPEMRARLHATADRGETVTSLEPVTPQAITDLADDLHERLAMQSRLDGEASADEWAAWWRQQVTEALEAAAPHLAAAERERCAQLAEHVSAAFPPPQCDHPEHWNLHGLNPFADLLRQGGGT